MASVQFHRLAALVILLDEELTALPPLGDVSGPDWSARRVAHDRAVERLTAMLCRREGAQITDRSGATMITLANLTASATAGREGALRSWRRAARAKLDYARGSIEPESFGADLSRVS